MPQSWQATSALRVAARSICRRWKISTRVSESASAVCQWVSPCSNPNRLPAKWKPVIWRRPSLRILWERTAPSTTR